MPGSLLGGSESTISTVVCVHAALMGNVGRIEALDRDARRLDRLKGNAKATGASIIRATCQDFLETDPQSAQFRGVEAMLLDPSCSGSGTVPPPPLVPGLLVMLHMFSQHNTKVSSNTFSMFTLSYFNTFTILSAYTDCSVDAWSPDFGGKKHHYPSQARRLLCLFAVWSSYQNPFLVCRLYNTQNFISPS